MRTPNSASALTVLIVSAFVVLVSGCGARTESAPRVLASQFADAVTAGDAARVCSVLAPNTKTELEQSAGKACAEAVGGENLSSPGALQDVASFGTMAQATFSGDVVFMTEFRSGWRVLAAGCTPQPGQPYDCELQGG